MTWISSFPGYSNVAGRIKAAVGLVLRTGPVPAHVGLIMDGNRRYAREHQLEVKQGHSSGFDAMAAVLELLYQSGVQTATVFAFSIDNFRRSSQEIEWLMDLAKSKLQQMAQHGELCDQYGIRIRIVGRVLMLPADVRAVLADTERRTAHNTAVTLNVCFPYTLRDEMAHAARSVVRAAAADASYRVDLAALEGAMYVPRLDLVVRTSGTARLSDFLLWQTVPLTCAVVFSEKMWPEFTPWDMLWILGRWSFNRYWYGSGSGQLPAAAPDAEETPGVPEASDALQAPESRASGFERA